MIEIKISDRAFTDSPDVGHSSCLCSRCGKVIKNNREGAIRGWTEDKALEYRFHYRCLGMEESTEPDWYDDLPEEYDSDYSYPEIEQASLGTCCICRSLENVFNIINLPYRTFIPGTGWGNVECSLPADGAIAVICNDCMQDGFDIESLQDVVYDYAFQKQRKPFLEVTKNEEFGLEEFGLS